MASSSSSSSRNWVYDVFVSFTGTDVRAKFLSHFQKELDRKFIKTFVDEKIEKSQSLNSVITQAIRNSRIAMVVFSENYGSSSWCLDELVEIVKCKEKLDQVVIPIFYGLDPTHVRNQTGKFGEVFAKTCERKSENEINLWRQSLTKVANLCGNHPQNWSNEAKMVEEICNDVLGTILNLIPPKESVVQRQERSRSNKDVLIDVGYSAGEHLSSRSSYDDKKNQLPSRPSRTKVKIQWTLLIIFFILEIPSCVLDQISSTDRPSYALVAMSLSLFACLVGLIDLLYKGIAENVVWQWTPFPWFYYTHPKSNRPFGSFPEMVGLICGVCQSILTTINYSFIIRKVDGPIKVSVWPLIFALGALISMYLRKDTTT